MQEKHSWIVVILDRSGSMQPIWEDTVGGLTSFIEKQKEVEGTAILTVAAFDTDYELLYKQQDLATADPAVAGRVHPRGGTALTDAVGKTIAMVRDKIVAMPDSEKPENVIVQIITDGEENASQEWKTEQVRDLIKKLQADEDWTFLFLAANQDAFAAAREYAIPTSNSAGFEATGKGMKDAYAATNLAMGGVRCCSSKGTGGAIQDASWKVGLDDAAHLDAGAKKVAAEEKKK